MVARTLAATEAQWQAQVLQLAGALGWRSMHVRRSIGKGHQWTTSTSCVGWAAGLETYVFRPSDLDEVHASLRSGPVAT